MVASGQHTPKIAVITRTKNRSTLLKRALQSIDNQTYTDYIHVIVNDGGNKKDLENLLRKYPNSRRKVIHNKDSAGLTPALNQGIQAVASEYVAIMDDDDSLHKERLRLTVEHLDTHPSSMGVVHIMDRVIEEVDGDNINEVSRNRWHEEMQSISLYKQCVDNYMTNGAFTYRRSLYEELKGYDESLPAAEDWDFGIRALLKYDIDVLQTEYAVSYYHHRPTQAGDNGNSVFAGIANHHQALNKLQNKYLREDILAGKLGVGYIMNDLHYERELDVVRDEQSDARVVRIEGHINFSADQVVNRVTHRISNSRPLQKVKAKLKTWSK
jgi:glycosyltransferase involved in cell wall biosynthesis